MEIKKEKYIIVKYEELQKALNLKEQIKHIYVTTYGDVHIYLLDDA